MKMFENVLIGERISVTLGVATSITGIASDVGASYVEFVGGITVYSSDGWKLVGKCDS